MLVSEALRQGRARIANPSRWMRRELQRGGRVCAHYAATLAMGAEPWQMTPAHGYLAEAARELIGDVDNLIVALPGGAICYVNNELGHKAVMRMYGRAIELAEASEAHAAQRRLRDRDPIPASVEADSQADTLVPV